jgi:hypothetical protein
MEVTFLGWAGLVAGLVILLLLDLFVFHRGAHEVPIRNAAWSTAGFVAVAVVFGVVLGLKFIVSNFVHIGVGISLAVIFGVMGLAIGASMRRERR